MIAGLCAFAVLVVAAQACTDGSSQLYHVLGSGSYCSDACPPESGTYFLRLAATDKSASTAREYKLADTAEHLDEAQPYPECMRAVVDERTVLEWKPADCP